MITIDYTASIIEEGEKRVFDTTIFDVATKETIYKPDKVYEPMLVVIGKEWIPKGLEKVLTNYNIGDELETTIECKDAYGLKDPSKIKLVARREFQKLNINPSIGDRINIGNQLGTVLSVSTTRVRMDYNHILAGKDIHYKIKIHELIEGDKNKIEALIKRRLPGSNIAGININIISDDIEVMMPEQTKFVEYVQFAKAEVAKDIGEIISNYKGIKFIDYFSFQ
ncbi:MAG: FKBP-type peptidyl-prolyl cis-trans isomerase [Candidatus Heimdallarchaeota archaeon]|nr:FKBP-type peptidyl-prolyl cis-trans isomerase [Candidatus Heimdallarchaeota archaeon]